MQLGKKLNFEEHLNKVESKVKKTITRKLSKYPSTIGTSHNFQVIHQASLRLRRYNYDKAFNDSFHAKLESLQYNATLAITGAIRRFSTEKIYEKLCSEPLKSRRSYRKMSFLYKVLKSESPSYLFNIIPDSNRQHQTRNSGNISSFFVKHDCFKNSFFLSAITEWNKLDYYISNADWLKVFKNVS